MKPRSSKTARIVTKPTGPLQENCHFIYDEEAGTGLIVDPGDDAGEIVDMITATDIKLAAILLTHGHFDHVGATAEVVKATGAPVYGSDEAAVVLASPDEHILVPGIPPFPAGRVDHIIGGDAELNIGGLAVRTIATPGHTPGSITFNISGSLFCGDLLFRGSVGRTDLPGGSFDQLAESIIGLMHDFPPGTGVYTGHGSSTTLGYERETNPFLVGLNL